MSSQNTGKIQNSQGESTDFSGIYPVYKDRGDTLAVLLDKFRKIHNLTPQDKLTYAGRLDPLAEGLVLVLAGESRFAKDSMLGVDKVYEVEILLGVETDTLDPLGRIIKTDFKNINEIDIQNALGQMIRITELAYPIYSSVPVQGKALFVHARAGTPVVIPTKKVKIKSVELIEINKVPLPVIANESIMSISKVVGDFRQTETIQDWQKLLAEHKNTEVIIVKIKVAASSGTYMRSLASWVGGQLGVPALAYKIKRLEIGASKIEQ